MRRNLSRPEECRRIFAALSEFLDGNLPARNCRQLQKHLSDCKPCIEYLETLKKTIGACRLYKAAPAPPPSPAVREAIVKALSGKPVRGAYPRG
jgi:anti-sigma factor RsiW